ncbi:MAG: sodium:solute symporter [Vulcanisaeta sp.]
MPRKTLLRLAGDLADSGFRGIIRAYYVRRGFGTLSIEFIIYRRPSSNRRLLTRIRRALETLPSLVAAVIIGFILVLIIRWII